MNYRTSNAALPSLWDNFGKTWAFNQLAKNGIGSIDTLLAHIAVRNPAESPIVSKATSHMDKHYITVNENAVLSTFFYN